MPAESASPPVDDQDTIEANEVNAFPYLIIYLVLTLGYLDHYRVLPLSPYFAVFFVFVLVPIFDYLFGLDSYNPSNKVRRILEKKISFKAVTMLWLPYYLAYILWGAWIAWPECDTLSKQISLVINVGIVSGVNINMAHELIHKHPALEQWLGKICLCLTSYGHFSVEHLQGHHRNVSTLEDPASSRKGESLYAFLPRTVIGSFKSAFHLDFKTCCQNWAITIAFSLLCIPWSSIKFFYFQGIIGFLFLEIINYIEHYGLSREPGELVSPMHSWNAGQKVTNYLLIKLQRHSDHHTNPSWRYQTLRSWPHSPQLPFGYATMVLIALVPPLWFKIMDPLVDKAKAHYAKLEKDQLIDKVFTPEYLKEHPEEMSFDHWKRY